MEGAREAPLTSSDDPTEFPEGSRFPVEAPQPHERVDFPSEGEPSIPDARPLTAAQRCRQVSRAKRSVRYEQILALSRQGLSGRAIAQRLHVSRKTVHRFLTAEAFPERAPRSQRQSKLDPYLPYLRERWEQGCHNGLQLAREIQAQGFRGSTALVSQLIGKWRASLMVREPGVRGKKRQQAVPAKRRVSARQASWLVVKPQAQLTQAHHDLLNRVCQAHADLPQLYQ